jgi:hypothetical protein
MAEKVDPLPSREVANPLHPPLQTPISTLVIAKQTAGRLKKKIKKKGYDAAAAQMDKILEHRKGKAALTDTIGMAISASQMFQLATLAASPMLPKLFLDFSKQFNLSLFSFKMLNIPSINVDAAEWVQSLAGGDTDDSHMRVIFVCRGTTARLEDRNRGEGAR